MGDTAQDTRIMKYSKPILPAGWILGMACGWSERLYGEGRASSRTPAPSAVGTGGMWIEHLRERGPGGGVGMGQEGGQPCRIREGIREHERRRGGWAGVWGGPLSLVGALIPPVGGQGTLGGQSGQLGLGGLLRQGFWMMVGEGEWQ